MATRRFLGQADKVAQVSTGSIDSVDATPSNNTFTVTIGGVSVSVAGDTDVNTTATNLRAALNASTHPYFAAATWSGTGGNIVGTADVAGVPFVPALTKSGAGTGTVTDFAATTASAGPNDWSTAANWSGAAVPVNGDTVIIENTSTPILWGLDQSAVTLAELRILQSYTGMIGLNPLHFLTNVSGINETVTTLKAEYRETYLKVGATLLNIGQFVGGGSAPAGASRLKINVGSVQTAATVHNTATASADSGMQPCRIIGTHASNTLTVYAGIVGVATADGSEVATIATIAQRGGTLTLAAGVTWSTVYKSGGHLVVRSASTTGAIYNNGGTLDVDVASGTIGTIQTVGNAVLNGGFVLPALDVAGGVTYCNTTGTVGATSFVIENGATADFSQSNVARTVAGLTFGSNGGVLVADANVVTFTTGLPQHIYVGPLRLEVRPAPNGR